MFIIYFGEPILVDTFSKCLVSTCFRKLIDSKITSYMVLNRPFLHCVSRIKAGKNASITDDSISAIAAGILYM